MKRRTEPVVEGLRSVCWGAMTETILFNLLLLHFEAENWGQFLDVDEKAERPTSFNAQ